MSSSFQQLMKKAQANTQSSSKEAAGLLAQQQAAERKARADQEARDKKERDMRKQQLMREIQAKKNAEADKIRKEEEQLKRQQERERKAAEEARNPSVRAIQQLQNGAKSRSSSPRTGVASLPSTNALTREEKRALANPLYRDTVIRPRVINNTKKNGRLPGGAVVRGDAKNASKDDGLSTRQRIKANFQTLTPLNTVKKDMRTIDEIARDLRGRNGGEQVEFTGEEAMTFKDWFGPSTKEKKKAQALAKEKVPSPPEPVDYRSSGESKPQKSLASSSSSKPMSSSSSSRPKPAMASGSTSKSKPPASSSNRPSSSSAAPPRKRDPASAGGPPRKRTYRSDDDEGFSSDSEPRRKKSRQSAGGYVPGAIAAMFGRDLSKDRARDMDFSDEDEEMEARDYAAIMREEAQSAKIARREDALAEAEEKRREAEKKRKRAAAAAAGA